MRTIDDFSISNYFIKRYYTKNIEIFKHSENLNTMFKNNPKLVIAVHHGCPSAPAVAISGVYDNFLTHGGGQRKPSLIAWRPFYKVPLLRHLVKYMTQVEEALSSKEFLARFQNDEFTDLIVLPEGDNSMFGGSGEVVPFVSPKFVEFSIRGKAPILIVAHNGTEKMATAYTLKDKYINMMTWLPKHSFKLLKTTRHLTYPHFLEHDLDLLQMYYRLYHPKLKESELSEDKEECLAQLQIESDKVHAIMAEMKAELSKA